MDDKEDSGPDESIGSLNYTVKNNQKHILGCPMYPLARGCNGFTYNCEKCWFDLDVQCSLISDNLTHDGHEHLLLLSNASDGGISVAHATLWKKKKIFRFADCEFIVIFVKRNETQNIGFITVQISSVIFIFIVGG